MNIVKNKNINSSDFTGRFS